MSAVHMDSAILSQLLRMQAQAGKPPAEVCATIAGLRDLCDLQTGPSAGDWRRGPGGASGGAGTSQQYRFQVRDQGRNGGRQQPFRSENSYSSLPSMGSASPGGGMYRSTSQASLSGGSGTPRSPMTPGLSSPSGPPSRYQSKFKNSAQPVEEKILNNIILSKLNKFSPDTYNDIRDFLYQILGSGEPDLADMIRDFMRMVFRKAAAEELYCALYAKLLAEISARYSVILEEMHELQSNYMDIFEDVAEPSPDSENYEKFVAKNYEKKFRQGYSQFMAELATLEILQMKNLVNTFRKLFEQMQVTGKETNKKALLEEYADCLSRMSRVLKGRSSFMAQARQEVLNACGAEIQELVENKAAYCSLSPKARFIVMNVQDILRTQ